LQRLLVTIATEANALMMSRLFEVWAERVFFPAVEERRIGFNYTGKVVLLMDRFEVHHTEKVLQGGQERNIDVVFLFLTTRTKRIRSISSRLPY
jgi:hypothetical protein